LQRESIKGPDEGRSQSAECRREDSRRRDASTIRYSLLAVLPVYYLVPRTIGICRGLDAFRYLDQWRSFLDGLGFAVRVSEPTTRRTIELGAQIAPAELCLPAKVYLGHVLELKDRVDALFLPRVVCQYSGKDLLFACPKSLALPDMTRALIPGLENSVELVLDEREESEERSYRKLAKMLEGRSRRQDGGDRQTRNQKPDIRNQRDEKPEAASGERSAVSGRDRVGVVGHPYLLNDRVLSQDLLAKLGALGVEPLVPEFALRPNVRLDERFRTNWLFEVELVDSAEAMARNGIDGLLLASSFACGTSAVTSDVIRREVAHSRPGLPVLQVFFDEHSGEAGLFTRLESFVELLRMRG
jgi:predicted nucleotide-binding protein (sugar kinase/HSP70/actin superfamily)